MRPRLLRAVSHTIAVFAVLSALLGCGIALLLSSFTRYQAESWHYILVGAVALGLVVLSAILHFVSRVYERRRVIRDSWDVVKNADTLDHDDDPAIDSSVLSKKTVDALTREVMEELREDGDAENYKKERKKIKRAIAAVAVAIPVLLTGALLVMQKKLRVKAPTEK